MAGTLYYAPSSLEQDSSGNPLNGGKLYFYTVGTETPKTVYQDAAFATPHSSPVVADSAGRFAPIYLNGVYKIVLKDSAGTEIWTKASTGTAVDTANSVQSIATNTSIDATHQNAVLRCTSTITLALLAVASAGEGFEFFVINDGTGLITIDPNGAEQVNDVATWVIPPGGCGHIRASASEWSCLGSMGIVQSLASGDILYINANKQLTRLAKGTNGQYLSLASGLPAWDSFGNSFGAQLLHVREEQAAATLGGTFTSGAWRTRTLNTVKTNEITSAALSANRISLPAGTYFIMATAPSLAVGSAKAKLYNVTDAADVIIGTPDISDSSACAIRQTVTGRFTIAGTKSFELQHQCSATNADDGFGTSANFSAVEVYSEVLIWRVL